MALTPEQIKALKPGDSLLIHGTFVRVDDDGDICIKSVITFCGTQYHDHIKYSHPSVVSIDKPEQITDPCRLFRKGDKVRTVKRRGRYYSSSDEKYADLILTVHSDEVTDARQSEIWVSVETEDDEICWNTDPVYLELVTPVEELVPYELVETTDYWSVEKENDELCLFWKKHHPHAKEAAEAERDRLNAEYRKEHNND